MKLETWMQTLLLSAALGAGSVSAIAVPAERLGGSVSASAGKDTPNNGKQRRAEKSKRKTDNHKVAADTEPVLKKRSDAADKSAEGAGEAVPENLPPVEPQSIVLRGVRG